MPDWRNVEDYAFTKNLTPEGWAWEFLRRNPKYRDIYKEVKELEEMEEALFGPYDARPHIQSEHMFYYDPELLEDEASIKWAARCATIGINPCRYRPSVWLAKQWGIKGRMPDPFAEYTDPPSFLATPEWPKFVSLEECSEYFLNEQSEPNYPLLLVGINLSFSIPDLMRQLKEQLTTRKRELEEEGTINRSTEKHRKGVWQKYLRALDASEMGAATSDIGAVLFLDNDAKRSRDRFYETLNRAIKLRDSGYRTIPILALKD